MSVNYPQYSGCGFVFRQKENGDAYTAMVIKDRVLMTSCRNGRCYEVGKTHGTGKLGFPEQFEADVELIVMDLNATVLVDGQSVGEYSLSQDFLTDPGYFGFSIVSGTNRDFGTRCDFSNSGMWVPAQ